MATTNILIAQAYAAFNRRDIDTALALMTQDVSWPRASEGGRAVGKEEIRAYWTRQWKQFDPHVEPIEVIDREGGITDVKVHQLVKSLAGDVLSNSEVWHVFTITNGLIERMDLKQIEASPNPSPLRRLLQPLARGKPRAASPVSVAVCIPLSIPPIESPTLWPTLRSIAKGASFSGTTALA
jgi:hypothetical protein